MSHNDKTDRPTWEILWKKKIFYIDFHILPEHRHIGGKIFPWRCIEWMNEYLFHRSFQIITSFHMHQYIELDFPYIWFTVI